MHILYYSDFLNLEMDKCRDVELVNFNMKQEEKNSEFIKKIRKMTLAKNGYVEACWFKELITNEKYKKSIIKKK
jgi:hypothetical protein